MNLLLIGIGINRRLFSVSNSNAFLTGSAKASTDYTPRFRNDPASRVTFDRGAKEATVTIALGDNDIFDGYGSRQFYVYLAEANFGNVDSDNRSLRITIIDNGMSHFSKISFLLWRLSFFLCFLVFCSDVRCLLPRKLQKLLLLVTLLSSSRLQIDDRVIRKTCSYSRLQIGDRVIRKIYSYSFCDPRAFLPGQWPIYWNRFASV